MPALMNDRNQNAPSDFPLARPLESAIAAAESDLARKMAEAANETAADILWALDHFKARRNDYALYHAYLDGDHRLTFATKGYREAFKNLLAGLRCNLCPRVVHALTDRLKLVGFEPHDSESGDGVMTKRQTVPEDIRMARTLWQDMRMDRHENKIYTEAVATGDAYLLIWPDQTEPSRPIAYPQRADQVVMRYDEERPDTPNLAAKLWRTGKRYFLTLYYADRIEKYVSRTDSQDVPEKAEAFEPRVVAGEAWPVQNPHGRVPMFQFPFEGGIGECGTAELRDIIPIQDALNKSLADLVVASEFSAFRQKWAIGVSDDEDDEKAIQTGQDRIVTVLNSEAKFGEFAATDLKNYTDTIAHFFQLAAQIKGIPLHTLMMSGDFPSGESLKTAEAPLVSRVEDTQVDFGDVWEDAMAFACQIAGGPAETHLSAMWRPAASRAEKDHTETVAIKRRDLGISEKQSWRELEYSEDEIARMEAEKEDESTSAIDALDAALSRQGAMGSEDAAVSGVGET